MPESPLIGIADDIFLVGGGIQNRLPFDAGRETRPAAPAQAGSGDLVDDRSRRHRQGLLQAAEPFMRAVIVDRQRVGDAAAGEDEACLPLQEGNLLRPSQTQGMVPAIQKIGGQ